MVSHCHPESRPDARRRNAIPELFSGRRFAITRYSGPRTATIKPVEHAN